MSVALDEKIRGCLYGAAIGAEMGFRKYAEFEHPADYESIIGRAFELKLEWPEAPLLDKSNTWNASLLHLLTSVASCYTGKKGRIIPEDWAAALKQDEAVSQDPAFWLMDIHSTQELLKEGTHPRLSGLGAVPTGNVCTAMIPVGIYHAGDPEGAYLDAVEIASVTQRSPAVEWAALTAAAVAEALKPNATPDSVIAKTLELAGKFAETVFDDLSKLVNGARECTPEQFPQYYADMLQAEQRVWIGQNPVGWALLLLAHCGSNPEKLIAAALMGKFTAVRVPVAGALAGALCGMKGWSETWVQEVDASVNPMLELGSLVQAKLAYERMVIQEIEAVAVPAEPEEVALYERIYGCILAGAIGNAMGSPLEAQSYLDIEAKYPGGVTTILEPSRLESEDDNQMAMLLIETYIRRNGSPVSARDFGETWKAKLKRSHFFYCMQNSYDMIKGGMDARIAGHWSMVTGSTVMCMEPVGMYHLCDPVNAYIEATSISYMYQRGLDVTAASILAASVSAAFRPRATVDSILQAALNAAPKEKMITFDKRQIETPYDFISKCLEVAAKYTDAFEARQELYDKCLYYHWIDPLELLGLSYAMFLIADGDVRLSAIGGTNIGRDSDTIAGRAAMLSGALRGSSNVPQEWINMFQKESLERIQVNSRAFTDFLLQKKLPYMKERQMML